jgi:hypothetical protein
MPTTDAAQNTRNRNASAKELSRVDAATIVTPIGLITAITYSV